MVAALSIWLALTASAAMQDSRMKAIDPTAVFGPAQLPILLRIDSDEFGADGLLDALAEDFMSQHHFHGRIAWYQDSDANGIVQLRRGNVDVAVVADTRFLADQEMPLALDIAHTHLVLVGPAANPAHIDIEDSSVAALRKIAGFGSRRAAEGGAPVFLSHGTIVRRTRCKSAICGCGPVCILGLRGNYGIAIAMSLPARRSGMPIMRLCILGSILQPGARCVPTFPGCGAMFQAAKI